MIPTKKQKLLGEPKCEFPPAQQGGELGVLFLFLLGHTYIHKQSIYVKKGKEDESTFTRNRETVCVLQHILPSVSCRLVQVNLSHIPLNLFLYTFLSNVSPFGNIQPASRLASVHDGPRPWKLSTKLVIRLILM